MQCGLCDGGVNDAMGGLLDKWTGWASAGCWCELHQDTFSVMRNKKVSMPTASQCEREFCFMRPFAKNRYNFCDTALSYIDGVKGRGVTAESDIPKGTIVCLFPGDEVYRLPERGLYPRDAWERRDREDEHIIDANSRDTAFVGLCHHCRLLGDRRK